MTKNPLEFEHNKPPLLFQDLKPAGAGSRRGSFNPDAADSGGGGAEVRRGQLPSFCMFFKVKESEKKGGESGHMTAVCGESIPFFTVVSHSMSFLLLKEECYANI